MMINIINNPTVIPETYIQFPGKKPPAELYGGTWTALYDEDGVFFRTGGGDALPFGGDVQGDAMRNLTGTFTVGTTTPQSVTGFSGVFAGGGVGTADSRGSTLVYNQHNRTSFDASRQVPTANEFRPKNITVRLWERGAK